MNDSDLYTMNSIIVRLYQNLKYPSTKQPSFHFTGLATQIKPDVGKGKAYQVPEYFGYNNYSYFDVEKDMVAQRVPQPSSGLSEYWGDAEKGKS